VWTDVLGWCLTHSSSDGQYWIQYSHLAEKPSLVKGDKVKGGETVLGLVGGGKNTPSGSASTGAHLHMAVTKMGANYSGVDVHLQPYDKLVDPLELFK
jgi:murein DD-endopeptidase MepM/ murein hydrolase activator NlpD